MTKKRILRDSLFYCEKSGQIFRKNAADVLREEENVL